MLAVTHSNLIDALSESFNRSADGYWYPVEAPVEGAALVRVIVAESGYCVERRASIQAHWLPVATVPVAEFNPATFRTWRRSWRMVA